MSNEIKILSAESGSWYQPDGTRVYEVPKKDGSGMRKPTIKDARANGWLPSATSILRILAKPELDRWKQMQAAMAVLTTPQLPAEALDTFVDRVLNQEAQQDQESAIARDRGKEIHAALNQAFLGESYDSTLGPWVQSVMVACQPLGKPVLFEKAVVGDGYAGRTDIVFENHEITVVDFKTCKALPRAPYTDHRLQLGAYAGAMGTTGEQRLRTANVYVTKSNPPEAKLFYHENWQADYLAFKLLAQYWCYANNFVPPDQSSRATR